MFLPSRVPIYLEYLLDHKRDVQQVLDELSLDWDLSTYSPVPLLDPLRSLRRRSGVRSDRHQQQGADAPVLH